MSIIKKSDRALLSVRPSADLSERRSFLKAIGAAGAAVSAGALAPTAARAQNTSTSQGDVANTSISKGDAALLRFAAAAEIIESDIWLQYNELGGVQDAEVPTLASKLIPGYPSAPTGGNKAYIDALEQLDEDMPQYISDNTEDELSHEYFLNQYLAFRGAEMVNLDRFRVLPSSQATGSNKRFGRLTNLTKLTVDTTWYTRYRSRTKNPDPPFNDTFPQAIPTLATGQHTAIPRTDADDTAQTGNFKFIQAIANTAGFHFAWIEQGGTSLYPKFAQRASKVEVLRILLSIGGTEICHFQTWHDKAGNAPQGTAVDPVTHVSVTFPDLNSPPSEDFQTNLIMPEPTVFLSRQFPPCSIIRPTDPRGAATGVVKALTDDGLFIGQSREFFELLNDLASDADAAQRGF